MSYVGVISLGLGNIASVLRMLAWLEIPADLVTEPNHLNQFSHLILPGVGHFTDGTTRLTPSWRGSLNQCIQKGTPLLGICLGMQLLCTASEEGTGEGLNYFSIPFKRIPNHPSLRVPHMGWNEITISPASRLLQGIDSPRFYFVHSYYASGNDSACTGIANYGVPIAAVLERDNICGVQFHPEKSHRFGMRLLRNFVETYSL